MSVNPIIHQLGRRLRLGVIGGGPGSFIGTVHRSAARLDDYYEIVAGVLSSDPERAREYGQALGIPRAYASADEMFNSELKRADGIDLVAIMTPNDSHYPLSCAALEQGLDVICDKPLTTNLDDALDFPTVGDGARGVKFIEAAVESSRAGGKWVDCCFEV